jgi:esterase/lipase superfamily enzyme|tara:strand:- start:1059 stop:1487 length:429 start_codon:yes stop_codon:yes gene_type:complete
MNMINPVLENFKHTFKDLIRTDWSQLGDIYADDILFRDPVHEIKGLVSLEDYFSNISTNLSECRFEYLDQVTSDNTAYLKWIMHFKHPRLGPKIIDVRGVSHIRYNEKIEYHEDLYDMGAMLYERLPVLGTVTRFLKSRMVS